MVFLGSRKVEKIKNKNEKKKPPARTKSILQKTAKRSQLPGDSPAVNFSRVKLKGVKTPLGYFQSLSNLQIIIISQLYIR